jgi:mercuric ion transport protein
MTHHIFSLNLYLVQGLVSTRIDIGATLLTVETSTRAAFRPANQGDHRPPLLAAGGLLGAVAATSCCVLPLALFSLGVGGVWIGRLSALAPYQPIFITITIMLLGYGYWLVYRKPRAACAEGAACARPLPNRLVKLGLCVATSLVLLALAWPYLLPLMIG